MSYFCSQKGSYQLLMVEWWRPLASCQWPSPNLRMAASECPERPHHVRPTLFLDRIEKLTSFVEVTYKEYTFNCIRPSR